MSFILTNKLKLFSKHIKKVNFKLVCMLAETYFSSFLHSNNKIDVVCADYVEDIKKPV